MNLFLLNLSHLFLDIYGSFLLPILPMLTAKFSMSIFSVSVVMSIGYLMSSTLQPVWGRLADGVRRPWFVLAGFLLCCVSVSFIGVVPSALLLSLCIVSTNLGEGLYHPQATAFINKLSTGERLNKNLGLYLGLGTFGFAAGPVIAGYIAQNWGLEYFVVMLIPALIVAAVLLTRFASVGNVPVARETGLLDTLKKIKWLIALGLMRPLILMTYCIFMPFLWQKTGYSVMQTGIFIGLFSLVGA
jgi:FSR family fosmidomycin resistance protein-like MFS transporter